MNHSAAESATMQSHGPSDSREMEGSLPCVRGPAIRRRISLGARKRPNLKIDADADETKEGKSTGQEEALLANGSTSEATGDEAIPWWMLEYRCPPPGHLGAHDVPVAANQGAKQAQDEVESESNEAQAKLERHETPERAKNRRPRILGMTMGMNACHMCMQSYCI